MFNYLVQTYEDGAWQDLNKVALPITDGDVLDETLAEGKFDLRSTSRVKPIKPFTRVRVKLYDGNTYKGKIQRVAGDTKRTTKRIAYPRRYDHDIQTLELTKIMERIIIGSMTSTKYITKDYQNEYTVNEVTTNVKQYYDGRDDNIWSVNYIPSHIGYIDIGTAPTYKLYYPVGATISADASYITKQADIAGLQSHSWTEAPHTILKRNGVAVANNKFTQPGTYTIEAHAVLETVTAGLPPKIDVDDITIVWEVSAYSDKMATPKSITSIVNRLLAAGKTRRKGIDPQTITFNAQQAQKYSQVPYTNPSEFAFTNDTLLDALMQIGGMIHAIPRLQVKDESENSEDLTYELVFDELGGNEDITDTMPKMLYQEDTYSVNDYCGTLDSPAQNLVNSQNVEKGAKATFGDQYITMRTETTQVEISADTAAFQESDEIEQMVQFWMRFGDKERNISPYVYEEDEYKTLSQLNESRYPYSTGWALCYKKGSRTITGFNNKLTTATVLTKPLLKYAIANIWKAVTGDNLLESDIINCSFKAIYVPSVQTRITSRKPISSEQDDIELFYNQGANKVETSAFGQKMRGAAARLGQLLTRKTYDFFSLNNLPKVGQIIDGAYIAQADYAFYQTKVRCTVTLAPNFNLLSQYVGLNTNYRLSDISTEQIADRYITYGEKIVFGYGNAGTINPTIVPQSLVETAIRQMLKGTNGESPVKRINTSLWIGYDENGDQIVDSQVLLPVMSFPFGTSWAFVCACVDNYGVGYQATDAFDVDGKHKRVQRLVPYSDAVGEIEYLGVWWSGKQIWTNDASAVADGGQANVYPYATNASKAVYLASAEMATGDYANGHPFVLMKDSRERIGVVYQIHLQANRDTIVIGSALADNCPLCTNYQASTTKAYILPHTINTFGAVDFTGATETTFTVAGNAITVAHNGADNVKSWVIVDDASKQIYIGENTSENQDGHFPIVYMTTK